MMDNNFKSAQARYKTYYNKHVQIEPQFAADDHVFDGRPSLMGSAADRIG